MNINNTLPLTKREEYIEQEKINILLDLTDSETVPLLQICEKMGVSYINSSMNADAVNITKLFKTIEKMRQEDWNTPHIISMGMNPGIVNIWTMIGIKHHRMIKGNDRD